MLTSINRVALLYINLSPSSNGLTIINFTEHRIYSETSGLSLSLGKHKRI